MKRLKRSFIKWVIVSFSCLLLGFLLGKLKLDIFQDTLESVKADLQTISAEKVDLSKKIARVEASLMADKQTIRLLTEENKQLNDQLNQLSNKLFFYERVVAPEQQSSGVKIYSFSVHKDSETGQCDYELVLMQSDKGRRLLTGQLALDFSVFENGRLKNVSIDELSENFASTFKFKYFQTIKGVFTVPAEMKVDEVMLSLKVAGNRWNKGQRLEQRYDWHTLIDNNDNLIGFNTVKL